MRNHYGRSGVTALLLFPCLTLACAGTAWKDRNGTPAAVAADPNEIAYQRLREIRVDVEAEGMPLGEVIARLGKHCPFDILPNWDALSACGAEQSLEISLHLKNASFVAALKQVLLQAGRGETELGFDICENVLTISTMEDFARRSVIVVYDVSDIVGKGARRAELPEGSLPWDSLDGKTTSQPTSVVMLRGIDDLANLIESVVDPTSWRDAGGNIGTIRAFGNHLVVSQTATAHQQIRALLRQLRESGARWME